MKKRMIKLGEIALATMATPALTMIGGNHSGDIGVALILSAAFWPITIPCLLIFSPLHDKYCKVFEKELNEK